MDPFIFEYIPVEISVRNLYHMCIHPKQPYISKKERSKMFRFKMAAKNRIFISKSRDQSLKNHFSKGIFSIKFGSKLENINTFTVLK